MPIPAAVSQSVYTALIDFNKSIDNLKSNHVPVTLGISEHAVGGVPAFNYMQVSSPGVANTANANAALFSALLAAHAAGYPFDCTTQKPANFRETRVPSHVFVTQR